MKFAWIAFIFIVLCNKVKTRPSTASNVVNKTLTLPKGKSVISQTIQQHETLPSHSAFLELTIKNRLMPKIQIKDTSAKNNNNSTFESTTRRPLMINRKFTSKPHSIHYIYTRTHGEQSNFSKRRNFNGKKRFKPQNNIKSTPNTSEDASSVEDRFQNFTDVGDIGELVEQKRKVSSNRQFNRRRGYLATAASEKFKSVALYTLQNTNKYRSKSRSAINESLQKIKTIRPEMKGMSITTKIVPTKVNENMTKIKNTQENKTVTTSELEEEIITEKFVHLTTIADEVLYLPITTEKSILSSSTTRNIETLNKSETSIESADKIEIPSKSDSGTIKSLPLIIVKGKSISLSEMHKAVDTITDRIFVSTEKASLITTPKKLNSTETISEKIESSEAKTEHSDNLAVMPEKSFGSVIEIQKPDKLVIQKDTAVDSINLGALDYSVNQTRKPVDLTFTTYKPMSDDELTRKTQKYVDSAIATETSAISTIITENPANTIEVSENSDLQTVKSVPLSMVTGESISISDMNNTIIEAIMDSNIVMPKEIFNPKIRKIEENIITVTPTSNEEQITTTERDGNHLAFSNANHLAMRRKRRINVIEEERTATTSTGNSFSERETHIGADLTYRNIHT